MYFAACSESTHPVSKYSTAFALITSRRSYIHNGKKMKRFSFAVVIVHGGHSPFYMGVPPQVIVMFRLPPFSGSRVVIALVNKILIANTNINGHL